MGDLLTVLLVSVRTQSQRSVATAIIAVWLVAIVLAYFVILS